MQEKRKPRFTGEQLYHIFIYVVLAVLAICILVPVAWVFMASIKQNAEFYGSPWALPLGVYWQNFVDAWTTARMGEFMLNSVLTTAIALALLLAATMSSTDSASVFSILRSKKQGLKQHLRPLLELESGSNDPMAYMLTILLIGVVTNSQGGGGLGMSALYFVVQLVVGTLSGYLIGRLAVWTINKINLANHSLYSVLLLAFIGIQQWRIRMMYRVESARQRESESLAKYSNLFNAMSIVYIQMKVIYDENGNPADALYCDVNSRYERIFIPREQAIGRRVSELFPFPMTEFMRLIKIAQTENRTITYPYYYEPRDIFYEVVISRSYLEEHIDIFCLDGTALYKTQQKLDSINHKLAMALDVADIVPWKWDLRKGSILCDVNKSVHGQMLAGTNADQQLEVPSESYFAKIHKEDRERVRRAYDDLIAGRKDKVREEYRVASDAGGRWHLDWVEAQATVDQRDDDGRPLNLIGSSLVITPRKRLEQDLRSARDRAEESNRLKSAFLANMSHEIRTPLNAIVGFSSILAETDEEQEKREYISIIENNNALLLQLIGDILDLSKIEAGTLEFNFSDFELNELMHEKENIIRMKTAEGVELIFEPGLDACLFHSDRNRLSQLLINLLTNAAKFTAKGSIRFGYRTEGSRLRFYVSDTGCGIPPEGQRRIFDRFVKLNSFKQGTGLGLPICKSIVEHLGGEIGVKSEEGRGTTFWFTLPYVTGKPCETPCGEVPTVSVEKDKLTILIAEDNDSNYRLFETILRRDYRLIHARDGEQAVELCRTEHPHLILMDINMPVMNGYEAAAEIRKFAAEIPIVAVTAYAYASDEQKIMQNGFTGYMPKPINAPQLKKQILDILRERITLI